MQKAVRWLVVNGIARLAEGACDQTAQTRNMVAWPPPDDGPAVEKVCPNGFPRSTRVTTGRGGQAGALRNAVERAPKKGK
jgi:hypothetical protein